jgi:hypothetical protein
MTRHADVVFVVLAWIFVIFRYLQAYVHVTSNRTHTGNRVSNKVRKMPILLALPQFESKGM